MSPRTADQWLQLARSFMEPRILLTAAELDLFTTLSAAPATTAALATRLGASSRGVTIILDALVALGALRKQDDQYACPAEAARYLSAHTDESVLPMLRHSANMWRRWSQLTEIVRGGPPAAPAARSPEETQAFIRAMEVVARPLAAQIATVVRPAAARRLLDIGGGPGTYTIAFLRESADLAVTLFDRPEVLEIAREQLTRAGMLHRVTLVGGDFDRDELPPGHDLALLSAIIHQNSHAQNVELYRKTWRALTPGGRLVIRDHVLEPDRTRPTAAAVFAVNMLVGTTGGNCYTFEEISADLATAGFERVRLIQRSEQMAALVEGFRPQS